jgi:hypothetical protein
MNFIKITPLIILLPLLMWSDACAQFVVHNNGALLTIKTGCVATIKSGDLINNVGTIDNAGALTVEGDVVNNDMVTGGGLNTGSFTLSGNWENNQTFTANQSRVILNGGNQDITGTAISSFYNLRLLGSGIKRMTIDADVLGSLELNGLELATQANFLRILNTSNSAIIPAGGFVSSLGTGRLSWNMNSTSNYVFPLGSSTGAQRIRPVSIRPTSAAPHTFAARMANVDATVEGFDVNQKATDVCEVNSSFFHLVDRVSGNATADVGQYYMSIQDGNWDRGGHWQNVPQWQSMGTGLQSSIAPYTIITTSGWSSFSPSAFSLIKSQPIASMVTSATGACLQGNAIGLSGLPAGGVFSGLGVQGNQFIPSIAGVGFHDVNYAYTSPNGCISNAIQSLEIYPQPQVSISADQSPPYQICLGDAVVFNATPGFANYTWSNSFQSESIEVGAAGIYSVAATDANGCQANSTSVSVTLLPAPNPVITANGPLEFCEGGSVVLSTSTGFGSYNWSSGATSVSTTAVVSGAYTVSVTNQYLCSGTSEPVQVNVIEPQLSTIQNIGDSMYVVPAGGSNFQWFFNGNPIPGGIGSHYIATQSGNYSAQFIGDNGCESTTGVIELTHSGGNVGVNEIDILGMFDIFPNPGKGIFNVNAILPSEEDVRIAFTDMLGKQLMPDIFIQGTNQFNQQVDLSQFANGVYFVRIQVADTSLTVRYIKS